MKQYMKDEQIKEISKLMKSISHPTRFKILCLLRDNEMSVKDLTDELETTNSNITQHLNILRNQGVIEYRRDANYIFNSINDWRILELLRKLRQLYSLDTHSTIWR